jgi:hypothetical protein
VQARDAIQGSLDRDRDLLFDFFGGMTLPLGDDLRRGISDIRVGLNCELRPAIPTKDRYCTKQGHDQSAAGQAKADEPSNH